MRSLARALLAPWLPRSGLAALIRRTAREHWRLLLLNLGSAGTLAFAEAGTFAVVFQAARFLAGSPASFRWPGLPTTPDVVFPLLLIAAVGLQVLSSLSRYINAVSAGEFAARCEARVLPEVHRHILSFSFGCASRYRAGDLVHQTTQAPLAVQVEIEQYSQIGWNILLAMVYLVTLLVLSPGLLLVVVLLGVFIGWFQSFLRPRVRRSSRELQQLRNRVVALITENIQILRLLHSTGSTAAAVSRLRQSMVAVEAGKRRLARLANLLEPVSDLLPVLAAVAIIALSWLSGGRPETLIPRLVTFVLALQRLNLRLMKIATCLNQLAENAGRIEVIDQLLLAEDKEFRRLGGRPFPGLQTEIRLQGVELRYPGLHEPSLCGIDLLIPRGATVALVGSSGAGKSSIADLLVGLLDPSAGRILVDGVDLQEFELDSWQRRLGVVSQDVLLVNDSIAANIAFGMEGSTDGNAIRAAARAAGADTFIQRLPEAYDTRIGERGYRLSGGQRQRLSLARAVLRNPEILILDEATSALDSHSEAMIHRSIEAFSTGRTVLSIAHRLSSIIHADMIAVLEQGHIVERGSHPDLLAKGGIYAALWKRQERGMFIVTNGFKDS